MKLTSTLLTVVLAIGGWVARASCPCFRRHWRDASATQTP